MYEPGGEVWVQLDIVRSPAGSIHVRVDGFKMKCAQEEPYSVFAFNKGHVVGSFRAVLGGSIHI